MLYYGFGGKEPAGGLGGAVSLPVGSRGEVPWKLTKTSTHSFGVMGQLDIFLTHY